MNPFSLIITEILYRPIFNLLVIFLILFQGELWWAIVALTLVIRLILLKPTLAGNDVQKHMSDIQPKMQEIQEKHKDDPQKMSEEASKLLKQKWTGPLKGCLMMLVQIPVFISLFFVIKDFSNDNVSSESFHWVLYSFIEPFNIGLSNIDNINHMFFGVDLLTNGNTILAIIVGILMYFQIKLTMLNKPQTPSMPGQENMPDMQNMMKYLNVFLVLMIAWAVYTLPWWVGLYITTTTLFGVMQYTIQYRELLKIKLTTFFSKNKDS